jgi:hypothetical protein
LIRIVEIPLEKPWRRICVSFEPDESVDLSAARVVQLGGRAWFIAPLSLRQILAIADHVPKLSALGAESISGARLLPLAEVLWHGLRRAYPQLGREAFFDLPITIAELVTALPVVIEQAGGRTTNGAPGDGSPGGSANEGESRAASASTASNGARSSLSL